MSTVVTGVLAPGREVDVDAFTDITPAAVTGVDMRGGEVTVTFATTLTKAQATACLRRITMTPTVEAAFTALEQRVTQLESDATNLRLRGA